MRLLKLAPLATVIALLGGCTCADTVKDTRFACQVTADCLAGNVCRGGECRTDDVPEGTCFPGERQACAVASCEAPCGEDGTWAACAPASGATFQTDPVNCGACGRRCSDRLGDSLSCIDARCTCTNDFDCPSGDVCMPGGVCVMNSDPCARLTCPGGSVCRAGACTPVSCATGCSAGEVCDVGTDTCRPILPCRFAEPCGDGGICEGRPQPDGERCNDGVACSFGDSCRAGACNGTAYSCPAPDQCQQAVACAGDGGCAVTPVTDGTPCDDGVSCTFGDQCTSGMCGGSAYTCTPNQCAATSVCAGDGGCDVTPRNVGSTCDDSQGCTFGDACSDAGLCEGTIYSCPGVTQCKEAGLCLGDGGCDVVDKPNGTPCDDGLDCNTTDRCASGVCSGTPITSFQDSDIDGRGNLTVTESVCPLSAGFVLDGGDCDDTNDNVQEVMAAAPDVDRDGVTATTTLDVAACVGRSIVINGRTYYRSATGFSTWLGSASPVADCNDTDEDVFESRPMMVVDADRDGYFAGSAITACVGVSSTINGRTYYANSSGAFVYLGASDALGADCLDSDADVFTNRSVATDADNDGFTTTTSTSTQCVGASSVINTRTYYEDATGTPTRLGSASAAADCNDGDPSITGTTLYYLDGDADTFGAGVGSPRCAPVAGESTNNTDCDDANGSIHTNRSVATDADNDSYTLSTSTSTACTGSSQVVNGRTYYRDASNLLTWLASASSTVDCDDANATVFPQTVYRDADGDTFGAATGSQVQCPRQTGWVTNSTDCNDTTAQVYRNIANLYDDSDQDGYSNSTSTTLCVGPSTSVGGRLYYRSTSGAYPYTTSFLGSDCNTSNGSLFTTRGNMVPDDDRDGYPSSVNDLTQCAGATSTAGGRTYYADGSGGYWMSRSDCIQKNGSNCDPAFVDCYDLNGSAHFTQTAYFTTHRGDGSFDYNCTGTIASNSTATYCASTSPGTAVFTDGSCVTSAGTATLCDSPTTFALPGACGKNTAGAATFTNPGVCTAATLANTTLIGCR